MCDSDELYKAKLAEQAERYNDMIEAMKKVVLRNPILTVEDRNLLSTAYKIEIGIRRSSLQILNSIEQREESRGTNDKLLELVQEYQTIIENEMKDLCIGALELLDEHLLPAVTSAEAEVFYFKMKGDHCRYLAEISNSYCRADVIWNSLTSYRAASEIATVELPTTHPIRLGLALNFSVFFYEILNSPYRACRLAKAAFNDAIAELDMLSEASYKDATLILQLLRDNLNLWIADINECSNCENKIDGE